MPIYPDATVKLVDRYKEGGSAGGPMPTLGRMVAHTAVSSAPSLYPLFSQDGQPTAHMYVLADGSCEQYVDSSRRSSAILYGNYDGFCIETQDIGGPFPKWLGSNVPEWTDAQVETLARIAVWLHEKHGLPLKHLLTSRPGHKGIGVHRLGIDGNFPSKGILRGRVPGGELWSTARGKVCPGDRRISQLYNEVIPLAQQIAAQPVELRTSGHVAEALKEIRLAIRKTKPDSPLRKSLRAVARSLRKILSRRPHEESNK